MTKDIIFKIPEYIKKLPKLNFTDQVILSQIDFLDNGEGCKASNNKLAKYIAKTGRTVQNIVLKLEQLGYVTREVICRYQRTLKCTFEKLSKPVEASKKVIEKGTKFFHTGTKFVRDIYNSKQFKSFNKKEIEESRKIELKVYQYDHETKEEFEARCEEARGRLDVIVIPVPKLDKKTENGSINSLEIMKKAYFRIKHLTTNY